MGDKTGPNEDQGKVSWADEADNEPEQEHEAPASSSSRKSKNTQDNGDEDDLDLERPGGSNYYTDSPRRDRDDRSRGRRDNTGGRGRYGGSRPFRGERGDRQKVPFPTSPPYKAFVGNVDFKCNEDDIYEHFKSGGCKIDDIQFIKNRQTGQFKGFCYIAFKDPTSLERAIDLHDSELFGRQIRVDIAEAQEHDRDRSGGSRGGGGDYRDRDRGSYSGRDRYDSRGGGRGSRGDARRNSDTRFGSDRRRGGGGGYDDDRRRSYGRGSNRGGGGGRDRDDRRREFDDRETPRRSRPSDRVDSEETESVPIERRKLALKPRTKSTPSQGLASPPLAQISRGGDDDPFGGAKPRELNLSERGVNVPVDPEPSGDTSEPPYEEDDEPQRPVGRGRPIGGRRGRGRFSTDGGSSSSGNRGRSRGGSRGGRGRASYRDDRERSRSRESGGGRNHRSSERFNRNDRGRGGRGGRGRDQAPKRGDGGRGKPPPKKKDEDVVVESANAFSALSIDDEQDDNDSGSKEKEGSKDSSPAKTSSSELVPSDNQS